MKALGIIILALGLMLGGYALNMDVSVHIPAQDFGYGIRTPEATVANIDKMAQRQNFLIFSGVLAVVGAILTGFASMRPDAPVPAPVALKEGEGPLDFLNEKQPAEPTTVSICPKCRSMGSGDDVECGRCGAVLQNAARAIGLRQADDQWRYGTPGCRVEEMWHSSAVMNAAGKLALKLRRAQAAAQGL